MKFLPTGLFLTFAFFAFEFNVNAQKEYTVAEVKGDGKMSLFEGNSVRLRGIVTARTRNGFFIQTPDAEVDNNPKTSEGIYVYTGSEPTAEATVGNLISVTGTVEEFRPKTAPDTLPITELSMKKMRIRSRLFPPEMLCQNQSFDGNAQVLDHVLINQPMRKYLRGFGYGRLNADFPKIYRNDQTRVERFSDHDAPIVYFTFDEKK